MKEKYTNEDFLTKWLAGDLDEKELSEFEASEVYQQFMAIDNGAKSLSGPIIDTEQALENVQSKIREQKSKTSVKQLWWFPAIAASLAIMFGAYGYFFGSKTYSTGIGEKETILLADGSMIEMNANSKLSHKRFGWLDNREVELEGEAFFDIRSGNDFTVETSKGTVSVLGTEFNIRNRENLKVQCYKGTIVFTPSTENKETIQLSDGMEIEQIGSQTLLRKFAASNPDWRNGFSSFTEQPFSIVLEELKLQYPIDFRVESIRTHRLFTGKFAHNNLESALKSTMEPMGIKYHISADKRIVTLSE